MIVSCGEALVDMVPEPVPGGAPMNVAIAAARLGAPAAFLGRISTDEHGDAIWAHLVSNDVDLRACQRGPEPTARAVVDHAPHVVYRFEGDDTADTQLTAADLSKLGRGDHVVHGGGLGLFRGRTADVLAALVERHDGIVSLDPNVRPQAIDDRDRWEHYHRRWLARSHLYKASDEDLEWIWPGRSADSCAEELLRGRACAVMITRGGRGVTVYTAEAAVDVAAQPVDIVDTVGAGDTFVAAVLASIWELELAASPARLAGLDGVAWQAIVGRAVIAAAITCSRPGADPPHRDELPA